MKKAYISFALVALWLIVVLFSGGDFAIAGFSHKGWINPVVMMRLILVIFYAMLFGWIVPLAFGFWFLWKQKQ